MSHISLIEHSTPLELKLLKYLQPRMNLSTTQQRNYQNLHKGYEGEHKLQNLLKKYLSTSYIVVNDLLLKENNSEFQIDTLLIRNDKIFLLEVKNFEGDFYIQQDNFFAVSSNNEIRNPLHQLKRTEILFTSFLKHTNFNFTIESFLIFINPNFHLYQAPLNPPIIYPTQINRFLKNLNANPFNQTNQQKELANFA